MRHSHQFELAKRLGGDFGKLQGVRAVALGGSLVTDFSDGASDVDLYVYADELPSVAMRSRLINDGRQVELDNHFWETGDEWQDAATTIAVDVTYRSPDWVESELDRVLKRHDAFTGYTTGVWHNVRTSLILADSNAWLASLKHTADQPYPDDLRQAIIAKNHPILRTVAGAYRNQIAKALNRDDAVSVHHRVTALLESVFDIIFAVNRETHPGEKRLLAWTEAVCEARPPAFAHHVRAVLHGAAGDPDLLAAVDALADGIDALLTQQGLLD
ncbi:MAG: DUF4037 domain-containing protein [Thermomicrobiales bacterium]